MRPSAKSRLIFFLGLENCILSTISQTYCSYSYFIYILYDFSLLTDFKKILINCPFFQLDLVILLFQFILGIKLYLLLMKLPLVWVSCVQNRYNSIKSRMFQNSYQNGTYFELFDPKQSQDKLKQLFRTTNVNGNNKVFDKQLKTFVLQFLSANAKMALPREEKKDLYLIQQFLVLQIYFFPALPWSIELVISDLTKTKRRIILSPAANKIEVKPFFVKVPCSGFNEGCWNNFAVDLYSFIEPFKGQTYRSLDAIYLSGHFKLRRIYTSTTQPLDSDCETQSQEIKQISFLPKNFYFPPGISSVTRINKYDGQAHSQAYEPTEPSTKNSSFLKSSKAKNQPPKQSLAKQPIKTQKIIKQKEKQEIDSKKIKDFLSNTNGELIGRMRKQQDKSQSESSQVIIGAPKTAKSTQKYTKKKNLIKTQQIPPKARSSLDKNQKPASRPQQKSKTKAKLNPWRTTNKDQAGLTDNSQLQGSKQQQRSVDTPQTVSLFKNNAGKFTQTKNNRFQGRSDHYSDSQYVQLSQKFSTLTDGKFFKHQRDVLPQKPKEPQDQQEIQENIEMQTNSLQQSVRREEARQKVKGETKAQLIHESICDSLQPYEEEKRKVEQMCKSSLYGFGQKLMKRFMNEVERPYSPPMGDRELTEQQFSEHFRQQKEEVELVYDPVLNCYYDHKTHTYYQLKN